MTKTQWINILEELKTIKYTNRFHGNQITYQHYSQVTRIGTDAHITRINIDECYLLLSHQVYIKHKDVLDVTPKDFKSRFWVTLPVFS